MSKAKPFNPLTMTDEELIKHCDKQVQALRMALDMIECEKHDRRHVRWAIVDALKEWKPALAEQPARTLKELHQLSREVSAQQALDKKAENARELGLDYEPEQPKVRTGDCLLVGVCASEGHKIAPQRTWVSLTEDEISLIVAECSLVSPSDHYFAQAIEAKLKEKNT